MRTKNEVVNRIYELNNKRLSNLREANRCKGTKAEQAFINLAFGLEPIVCNLGWVIGWPNEQSLSYARRDEEIKVDITK